MSTFKFGVFIPAAALCLLPAVVRRTKPESGTAVDAGRGAKNRHYGLRPMAEDCRPGADRYRPARWFTPVIARYATG